MQKEHKTRGAALLEELTALLRSLTLARRSEALKLARQSFRQAAHVDAQCEMQSHGPVCARAQELLAGAWSD